ncbi:MAG: hypothetical protein ABI689_01100 [Thermoanaerobaculia bacterium]
MTRLCTTSLVAALVLLAATGNAAEGAGPAVDPMRETLDSVRTVGAALFAWGKDQGFCCAEEAPADSMPPEADLSRIPVLSAKEVEAMLVPRYLTSLKLTDGWGRELEVRLDRGRRNWEVMAVRSAGADGKLEGNSYSRKSFDKSDPEADIVWADGFFVRWPGKLGK